MTTSGKGQSVTRYANGLTVLIPINISHSTMMVSYDVGSNGVTTLYSPAHSAHDG
ncbi:hypothetical protein BDW22DRAFT_1351086 [Trametopsis cervina]|nr:hypothetical protein BDW22DRAFT_1351086 [Trametopsis cervina]